MKTLNELYKLLLLYYVKYNDEDECEGICNSIKTLRWFGRISFKEHIKLLNHFKKQYDSKIHYENENYYWWSKDNFKVRINFIKMLIHKTNRK